MYYYCNKIRDLLRAGIGDDKIRYYLIGSPDNIPETVAGGGFIIIDPVQSTTTVADSQRDAVAGQINIYVGVQARLDYNGVDYEQDHLVRCMDLMEGTNDSGVVRTDTVKYILRQKINTSWIDQKEFTIDYTNQRTEAYVYCIKLLLTIYDQRNRNN